VKDQTAALEFYTKKVGFEKKTDYAPRSGYRWVTVGPKDQDLELAFFHAGMRDASSWSAQWEPGRSPPIILRVADCRRTFAELGDRGVEFKQDQPEDYPWSPCYVHRPRREPLLNQSTLSIIVLIVETVKCNARTRGNLQPESKENSGPLEAHLNHQPLPSWQERYQQVAPPIPHSMGVSVKGRLRRMPPRTFCFVSLRVRVANRGRDQAQARSQGRSLRLRTWAQG
jgi:hypothetical protein